MTHFGVCFPVGLILLSQPERTLHDSNRPLDLMVKPDYHGKKEN